MTQAVRHILSAEDFTREEIEELCGRAQLFAEVYDSPNRVQLAKYHQGKACVTVFGEASTRTRMSSEMASGKILGMHVSSLTAESAAMVKGETPGRTALTLGAAGADLIVMRMPEEGIVATAAKQSLVPVVNAGDGANEHPTQMLLDIATARGKLGSIEGSRWTVFGDIGHSRTLNSLLIALAKYRVHLTFVYSEGLGPSRRTLHYLKKHKVSYTETGDLKSAVKGAQVLYGIRTQAERHKGKVVSSSVILNRAVLKKLDAGTVILHPGPHGPEIADEVYEHPNAVFPVEQVRMGLHMRSALFDLLLGSAAYKAIITGEIRSPQEKTLIAIPSQSQRVQVA